MQNSNPDLKLDQNLPKTRCLRIFLKLWFLYKTKFFKNPWKSGLGVVLVQFWIRIRILHEKLYILLGSNPFFIEFWKIDFLKIQYFGKFRLSSYISAYFDSTIRRALKKHAYCLIFIIFGWNRGLDTPKQHLESSSAIISTLNPS